MVSLPRNQEGTPGPGLSSAAIWDSSSGGPFVSWQSDSTTGAPSEDCEGKMFAARFSKFCELADRERFHEQFFGCGMG